MLCPHEHPLRYVLTAEDIIAALPTSGCSDIAGAKQCTKKDVSPAGLSTVSISPTDQRFHRDQSAKVVAAEASLFRDLGFNAVSQASGRIASPSLPPHAPYS
jgi:hypothetical protein